MGIDGGTKTGSMFGLEQRMSCLLKWDGMNEKLTAGGWACQARDAYDSQEDTPCTT